MVIVSKYFRKNEERYHCIYMYVRAKPLDNQKSYMYIF